MKVFRLKELMKEMAYRGAWRPVFEYFAEEVKAQTSIRDYLEGEKAVQTLHLVYMNLTNYFVIYPHEPDELFRDLPGAGVKQGLRGLVDVAEFSEPSGDAIQLRGGVQIREA